MCLASHLTAVPNAIPKLARTSQKVASYFLSVLVLARGLFATTNLSFSKLYTFFIGLPINNIQYIHGLILMVFIVNLKDIKA